jgi:beta-ureidopropionase / N-carbamoyl-L-amino-acid hydrolase
MHRRDFTARVLGAVGGLGALSTGLVRPGFGDFSDPRVSLDDLRVNGDRLNRHLTALAEFGKNPQGGVSRTAYSDADKQGRDYVMRLMRDARLDVALDTAGNIYGRRAGSDARRKPLMFGSHIDSVPEGGNYDGTVGSLGAIEVAQTLAERSVTTRHPIEVIIFQNEEGGTVGSRALISELHEKDLGLVARSGKTLRDGMTFIGANMGRLAEAGRKKGDIAAYVELHIEQGGTLEEEGLKIGIVEGIVGIGWWDVTIEGFSNHAGTTPMNRRKDAMLAAGRFIELVNRVATSESGRQVGTVGRIQALPGAPNVIPGRVVCSLEFRDLDSAKITALYERVKRESDAIAKATGTTFTFAETYLSKPALTSPRVQQVIAGAAKTLGLTTKTMPSGAGHDAQHVAMIAPAGMIFVPSVGGISHSPKEYSKPEDCVNGANALLQTVLAMDAMEWS